MSVEGFWYLAVSEDAIAAGIELASGLLLLHDGHIRSMESTPTVSGHYRINGSILTCFFRSLATWSNLSRPICQLDGELRGDIIELRGTCDDRPRLRFDARLARPKTSARSSQGAMQD